MKRQYWIRRVLIENERKIVNVVLDWKFLKNSQCCFGMEIKKKSVNSFGLEQITSDVRDTGASRHNGGPIEGASSTPQCDSAVIV